MGQRGPDLFRLCDPTFQAYHDRFLREAPKAGHACLVLQHLAVDLTQREAPRVAIGKEPGEAPRLGTEHLREVFQDGPRT